MSRNSQRRHRRERLWIRDPHCFFCRRKTVLPPYPMGEPQDHYATVEHLRSRLNPTRQEPNPQWKERTVLCCWRCNNDRNHVEQTLHRRQEAIDRTHAGMAAAGIRVDKPKPDWVTKMIEAFAAAGWPVDGRKPARVKRLIGRWRAGQLAYADFVDRLRQSLPHAKGMR